MSSVKVKSVVLAVGVAGIAATGAWLGAGLKDGSQKRKKVYEAQHKSPEEAIAGLEATKAQLVETRENLEKKIAEIEARRASRKTHDGLGNGADSMRR